MLFPFVERKSLLVLLANVPLFPMAQQQYQITKYTELHITIPPPLQPPLHFLTTTFYTWVKVMSFPDGIGGTLLNTNKILSFTMITFPSHQQFPCPFIFVSLVCSWAYLTRTRNIEETGNPSHQLAKQTYVNWSSQKTVQVQVFVSHPSVVWNGTRMNLFGICDYIYFSLVWRISNFIPIYNFKIHV